MKKHNQKGFGLIEGLLTLLVLSVISFGGYYVWHTQHNKTTSNLTTSAPEKTNSSTTTTPAQQYFTIKEWGVRVPNDGSLNLKYSLSDDKTLASVTSSQLLAADPQCTRGGAILRALPSDPVGPAGDSAKSLADQKTVSYAYIGGYYYIFVHDQAACSEKNTATTLQTESNDNLKILVPKLQAIPQ